MAKNLNAILLFAACLLPVKLIAQQYPVLTVNGNGPSHTVSTDFYGMMTEEINHSYDGGLYAEMIRNRNFREDSMHMAGWNPVGDATLMLDDASKSAAGTGSRILKVKASALAGVSNEGYWGIAVKANTTYDCSFYAKTDTAFSLNVAMQSHTGHIWCSNSIRINAGGWQRYELKLRTGGITASEDNRFIMRGMEAAHFSLGQISLFPPTYHNRRNGNREDLMNLLAGLHPSFLRLPGGNFLDPNHYEWKKTIGPVDLRQGHKSGWHYRTSDGLGILEFMEWCEDLHIKPVLGVSDGHGWLQDTVSGKLEQDALNEIEFISGDTSTRWGNLRAKYGHPSPFRLTYVEIGNEDGGDVYERRFATFYDAVKKAYPKIQLIATSPVMSRRPDILDEHYYASPAKMLQQANIYDSVSRQSPKIFIGEWATQSGSNLNTADGKEYIAKVTPDLTAALADAAWLTGLERNSDLVIMEAYAPLLANEHPFATQWPVNLIGFDALHSYGSPSYYVQSMFAANTGTRTVAASLKAAPGLYQSVTENPKKHKLFIKLVNTNERGTIIRISVTGMKLMPNGKIVEISNPNKEASNSLDEPTHVAPQSRMLHDLGGDCQIKLKGNSVNVIEMKMM